MSITVNDIKEKISKANKELLRLYPAYNDGCNRKQAFLYSHSKGHYTIEFLKPNCNGSVVITDTKTRLECYDRFNPIEEATKMYNTFCTRSHTYCGGTIRYSA